MDALTTGLKRITLKLPSKEEYEAREKEKDEKQKSLEASKKAPAKTATKKPTTARTTAAKPAAKSATAKRGPGRPPKSSKPASPVETVAVVPTPESPQLQSTATAPLVQPQPVQPDSISALVQVAPAQPAQAQPATAEPPAIDRRTSAGLVEPPTENTPIEQLREQLPKPSFITVTEPSRNITPPPRADTPPPPPPSNMPEFVNYTTQSFNTAAAAAVEEIKAAGLQPSAPLQWLPPSTESGPASSTGSRPMSPASKRSDLPVFTANGAIPFAPNHSAATVGAAAGHQGASTDMEKERNWQEIWDIPDTPGR